MNEAIEALKVLLPQSDKNRFRVTKVSVLNEAIEYIQRIKGTTIFFPFSLDLTS